MFYTFFIQKEKGSKMDIEKTNGFLMKTVLIFSMSAIGLFGLFSLTYLN